MKQATRRLNPKRLDVRSVVDNWVARSRWWSTDERRVYFRLLTTRGVIEIYRLGHDWYLSRVAD